MGGQGHCVRVMVAWVVELFTEPGRVDTRNRASKGAPAMVAYVIIPFHLGLILCPLSYNINYLSLMFASRPRPKEHKSTLAISNSCIPLFG